MNGILRLDPALKDYIWGGTKLKEDYGSSLERVAEAWVCSCHKDGKSVVSGGVNGGETLDEAIGILHSGEEFPFLIKLIDAKQNLSVQVHPDDEYAQKNEGQPGKTEMWYILDAAEGAGIYYGFKNQISRDQLREHIEKNTLTDALNFVNVKPGESYFIEAGTIHAIGAGLLIAEIQQNSNVTYRVYDYGRIGADKKPRELHIDRALDVTKTAPAPQQKSYETVSLGGGTLVTLADCKYFKAQKLTLDGSCTLPLPYTHTALLAVSGSGVIAGAGEFGRNDCFYVPSGTKEVDITGRCEMLIASA